MDGWHLRGTLALNPRQDTAGRDDDEAGHVIADGARLAAVRITWIAMITSLLGAVRASPPIRHPQQPRF